MDHVLRRQPVPAADDTSAGIDRTLRHGVALDVAAAASLQRAGDAGAHPEMIVRGIDDGVDVLGGEVAVQNFERDGRYVERDQLDW